MLENNITNKILNRLNLIIFILISVISIIIYYKTHIFNNEIIYKEESKSATDLTSYLSQIDNNVNKLISNLDNEKINSRNIEQPKIIENNEINEDRKVDDYQELHFKIIKNINNIIAARKLLYVKGDYIQYIKDVKQDINDSKITDIINNIELNNESIISIADIIDYIKLPKSEDKNIEIDSIKNYFSDLIKIKNLEENKDDSVINNIIIHILNREVKQAIDIIDQINYDNIILKEKLNSLYKSELLFDELYKYITSIEFYNSNRQYDEK